jgi:hypothetical protein
MYTSLHKADIVSEGPGGPIAHQTDHRSEEEIAAEPELSTLFAIARVLVPRNHLAVDGKPIAAVHYVPLGGAPAFLVEALGAVGAKLERTPGQAEALPGGGDAGAIADRAFGGLARRVCERIGTDDRAACRTRARRRSSSGPA